METRAQMLERLENVIQQDVDVNEILAEVSEIKKAYLQNFKAEVEELKFQFTEDGNDENDFVAPEFEDKKRFDELMSIVKERKDKKEREIKDAQDLNLKTKQDLIAELHDIIQNEENITKAFNRMNAVRDKWKETGEVSPHAYKDLQNDYSKKLEEFFYHINIYKELKEHDLKKNLEQREGMIAKMKELLKEENINTCRSLAGVYLSEWDEIGPVHKEDWEKVRDEFRAVAKDVFDRIKKHFNDIKEQRQKNLDEKQKLVEKVKNIVAQEISNIGTWKKKTDEILKVQEEWKKIGFALKKENDAIWEEFRGVCNEFFNAKKEFFGEEKEKWNNNKERKEKLVQKAEELMNSTEWKQASFDLIKLQKEWKKIGLAGQKFEQILWNKFRAACDHFFNAKKEYFDTLDDRLADNLKKKKDFIAKLEKTKLDKEKGADEIKVMVAEWEDLGMVPRDNAKDINEAYRKAIDALYSQLGLDKDELQKQKFADKLDNLQGQDNAEKLLQDEKRFINDSIDKLEKEKLQLENNLSFFAFSKGAAADKMKAEAQGKIDAVQAKIEEWAEKRKQISIAIRALNKPVEAKAEETPVEEEVNSESQS